MSSTQYTQSRQPQVSQKDVFADITQEIITAIEEGKAEYRMPWNASAFSSSPVNACTGKTYRGINILSLWGATLKAGWSSHRFATYRQWSEYGCQVRKGERSTKVVFWDTYTNSELEDEDRPLSFVAKSYSVFNADQVDGYDPEPTSILDDQARIADAEAFFLNLRSDIKYIGNVACYSPSLDTVKMPSIQYFERALDYYSVLSHEHIHWSGHKTRLNRDMSGRFGEESYAMEELVAELGAAFLCAQLGVKTSPRTDHAGYIESWLKVLRKDTKAVLTAASTAQRAVDYLVETANAEPRLVGKALGEAIHEVFGLKG